MNNTTVIPELEKLTADLRGRISHLRTLPDANPNDLSFYGSAERRLYDVTNQLRGESRSEPAGAEIGKRPCKLTEGDAGFGPIKRGITDHQINPLNDAIQIFSVGAPGAGGAATEYEIHLPDRAVDGPGCAHQTGPIVLRFQSAPLLTAGVNGITTEALLAIAIDRLRGFQSGQFSCRENSIALTHLEDALLRLQSRSRDRARRGVEGQRVA